MAENNVKSIVFPAKNVEGEAKLKRLCETIADYMGAKVTFETVMVLQVNFPKDRPDIETIMKRLAGIKTGLNQVGRIMDTKPKAPPIPEIPQPEKVA